MPQSLDWQSFGRRVPLEGLRGIAAINVVLFHAKSPGFANGYAGVDVFFVLSGFLISSLLIRELVATNSLSFLKFYARRARRLLPASLVVLLITAVIYTNIAPPLIIFQNRSSFLTACVYIENWNLIAKSKDYFAQGGDPSPVTHYWSLGVEEQFYLAWPVLMYILYKISGKFEESLIMIFLVLCSLGSVVWNFVVSAHSPSVAYFGTQFRVYQLFGGSIVAILAFEQERGTGNFLSNFKSAGTTISTLGLAGLLLCATSLINSTADIIGVLTTVSAMGLLIGLEVSKDSFVANFLSHPILRILGKYSYSIYLWHYPLVIFGKYRNFIPEELPLVKAIGIVVTSILLAAITWWTFEGRINAINLKDRKVMKLFVFLGILSTITTLILVSKILVLSPEVEAIIQEIQSISMNNSGWKRPDLPSPSPSPFDNFHRV